MCGIFAIRSRDAPVSSDALLTGMRALRHRGPDGHRHWVAANGRVGLAHTRLSIIDLETGAQPIASEDGRVTVVVNGEVYGFEAIRTGLERKGHQFRTKSDAEIIVHLYEDHGSGCLEYLRGEFAFVLWDDARQSLLAARDRFGIKPLFFAQVGHALYLASEAKALFAGGVPAAWNEDAVFQSLFACVSAEHTLFRDVRQIPPGHLLEVSANGALRIHRYWDADYPIANGAAAPRPRDCTEQVRSLLDDAVRLRMRADVPVGCMLSGGLDSSTVLGLAARYTSSPLSAFTITFDDPAYDEGDFARQAAAFGGANLTLVPATRTSLAENFEESVRQGEIIQYNAHGTARYLLSRAIASSGYKTVLAGEGADELFAGYGFCGPAIRGATLSRRRFGALRRVWQLLRPKNTLQRSIARSSPWLARASRVVELPVYLVSSLAQRMSVLRGVLAPSFLHARRASDPYRELFESLAPIPQLRGREPAKQLIYLWLKTLFPGYVLAADRADMAHGVEVRLPFLDHVLFDYMRTIPVQTLAYGGEVKHLLREAAAPYIAPVVRNRLKKPLMAPPFSMQPDSPLLAVVNDLLRSSAAREQPFFNAAALLTLLDGRSSANLGQASLDPILLMAASLCILGREYRITSV